MATHVELAFRDAFMTRADMWRFVVSELAQYRSIYKGQKLIFLGNVRICVKSIYRHGKKVSSAFFGPGTKPIFRSESARFIIYIQMSSEMWEFDSEGSGEIMFTKVVDGFLPELFRRWQELSVRHSLTIILFTRMQYEEPNAWHALRHTADFEPLQCYTHRDFYHTLVNDATPDHLAGVLSKLKKEFKSYLKNASTMEASWGHKDANGNPTRRNDTGPATLVAGRPSPAAQGNILEAINLAASQFSQDRVDRDITRTGLSVVVVTPGSGVFEVNDNTLGLITDRLLEDGIVIDLVCLARMPLHSVPLLKYRRAAQYTSNKAILETVEAESKDCLDAPKRKHAIDTSGAPASPAAGKFDSSHTSSWRYSIPQWIDVSFWHNKGTLFDKQNVSALDDFPSSFSRTFIPRIRMYKVQMMGIMENETQSIKVQGIDFPRPQLLRGDNFAKDDASGLQTANQSAQRSGDVPLRQRTSTIRSSLFSPSSPHPSIQEISQNSVTLWMDGYDKALFASPGTLQISTSTGAKTSSVIGSCACTDGPEKNTAHQKPDYPVKEESTASEPSHSIKNSTSQPKIPVRPLQRTSNSRNSSRSILAISKPRQTSFQHSFGFRGVPGALLKALPVIEVSSEVAHRQDLQSREPSQVPSIDASEQSGQQKFPLREAIGLANQFSKMTASEKNTVEIISHHSRPITIKPRNEDSNSFREGGTDTHEAESIESSTMTPKPSGPPFEIAEEMVLLAERDFLKPWLLVSNPSNPSTTPIDPSRRLGKWRHVFPRPIHTSHIKWKSLCSPASIPLTTETSQAFVQLDVNVPNKYQMTGTVPLGHRGSEFDFWLLKDMIAARLCQGFQVIAALPASISHNRALNDAYFIQVGSTITMCKGELIHQLVARDGDTVEIRLYPPLSTTCAVTYDENHYMYNFNNRTTLDSKYELCSANLSRPRKSLDWASIDSYLARQHEQSPVPYPETLAGWEARFALIPLRDLSNSGPVGTAHEEDNEEEIRLEGIYKLTQIWQNNKHTSGTNRLYSTRSKMNDFNPLDIIFRTQSVSSVVASELHEALLGNGINEEDAPDLLSEAELFDKSDYDLSRLAATLQSERGIRLRDRRWHWRLHYNCFIGLELATWLLENFRNVKDRSEAVDLGNELMQSGLFTHVEKRHEFRDGNYFYQITSEHRHPRTDVRNSWLHRLSSVPSTPIADLSKDRISCPDMQSTSVEGLEDEMMTKVVKVNRPKVSLSKKLIYDVDRRKRFHRREVFNLHYDRVSSADDCYHVRIDWLNTTPKLVEEALSTWINTAERHGLRLVQVPICEASRIGEVHPFCTAYTIKLARNPPKTRLVGSLDAVPTGSMSAIENSFQRAILRRFDFVLDIEAATDFPASVDVSYSWGKPTYQYPQYVSRNGVLLAQVTKSGDILLLPNSAAGTRGVSTKISKQHQDSAAGRAWNCDLRRFPGLAGSSGLRSSFPASRTSKVDLQDYSEELELARCMKDEIEAFCSDSEALARFFEESHRRMLLDSPKTPILPSFVSQNDPPSTLMLGA